MIDHDKVALMTEADSLRRGWQACEARLAVVEAERDRWKAATKRLEDAVLKAGCAVDSFAFHEDCIVTPNVRELRAERHAAQAGEARAVEALVKLSNEAGSLYFEEAKIRRIVGNTNWSVLQLRVDEARAILDASCPALAWLSQQRREAAAEENNRWANGWWDMKEDMTASVFYARAAALRAGDVGNE